MSEDEDNRAGVPLEEGSSGNGRVFTEENVMGEVHEFGSGSAGHELLVSVSEEVGSKVVRIEDGEMNSFVGDELHACSVVVDKDSCEELGLVPQVDVDADGCAEKLIPSAEVTAGVHVESATVLEVNMNVPAEKSTLLPEVNVDVHAVSAPFPEVSLDSHVESVPLKVVNVNTQKEESATVMELNMDVHTESGPVPELSMGALAESVPAIEVNVDTHTEESAPVTRVNDSHAEVLAPVLEVDMDAHEKRSAHILEVDMDTCTEESLPPSESMCKTAPITKECSQQTMLEQIPECGLKSAVVLPDYMDVSLELAGIEPRKSLAQDIGIAAVDANTILTIDSSLPKTLVNHLEEFSSVSKGEHPMDHDVLESKLTAMITPEPKCILTEQLEPPSEVVGNSSFNDNLISSVDTSNHPCTEGHDQGCNHDKFETPAGNAGQISGCSGRKNKQNLRSSKKDYSLRSLTKSERVLRSRSQEKPKAPEPNNNGVHVKSGRVNARKKRKRKVKKKGSNEYSRIRNRLRYLLHRISLENSLLDAYSTEGWKGRSLEFIKPEKELQRAKSEINRYKLKIRGLFQSIDSLSAEGRLPESLFDSEGEIDSEDIFCAKCGSKDVSLDNDIILCDGVCERGFHQYCLEPPLLKEDIPSGDEGWMCPACDCKIDCLDMVDDSLGTNLSISDSWEKVFPEAVAGQQNDNIELSSDESDDDYNPDGEYEEQRSLGSASSSDESEDASVSEGSDVPADDKQCLGLPSDDSEDDDFDPDAPDPDANDEKSSDSDFTSASEDLGATLDADKSLGEGPLCSLLDSVAPLRGSKLSLKDELASLKESVPDQVNPETFCQKRHVERLDYKRLYDEFYGNIPSSSSDDEDFSDYDSSRKKKGKGVRSASNGETSAVKDENNPGTKRRGRKRNSQSFCIDERNHSPTKAQESSSVFNSSGKRARSSEYKRLGESVTKKLYQSFKENQYPNRETKQSLATELGITAHQVSKWFENARWSSRHSLRFEAILNKDVSKESSLPQMDKKELGFQQQIVNGAVPCSGVDASRMAGDGAAKNACDDIANKEPIDKESCKEKPISRRSGRTRSKQNQLPSNSDLVDEGMQGTREGLSELQAGDRTRKRRRGR